MRIREQRQLNPVSDEVLALTAVVRPILTGTLYALKAEIVAEVGGYEAVKMLMLPAFTEPEMETAEYVLSMPCMKPSAVKTPVFSKG